MRNVKGRLSGIVVWMLLKRGCPHQFLPNDESKLRRYGVADQSTDPRHEYGLPRLHKAVSPRERLEQSGLSEGDRAVLFRMSKSPRSEVVRLCRDCWRRLVPL